MATNGITKGRIEHELKLAPSRIEELDDLDDLWDQMPDWEQADWSLEWEQFLNILDHILDAAYRTNQMAPDQQVKYLEAIRQMKERMPIIERLGLTKPKVSIKT